MKVIPVLVNEKGHSEWSKKTFGEILLDIVLALKTFKTSEEITLEIASDCIDHLCLVNGEGVCIKPFLIEEFPIMSIKSKNELNKFSQDKNCFKIAKSSFQYTFSGI